MTRSQQNFADVKTALEAIRKEPRTQRFESIRHLAGSLDPATDLVLLHLLADRHSGTRETALEVLAERSVALGRIAARAALEDDSSFVRNQAVIVLGEIGTSSDVRRLTHALQDHNWVVRASAADSLGRVGGKAAWISLQKAMVKDKHPVVRRDAAFALSYSRQEKFAPILEQALSSEREEQARIGLLAALYALGQRRRLHVLLEMLHSEDSTVRHAVLNLLAGVVCPDDCAEAVQAVYALVAHESNPGVQADAQRVAEHLSASATNADDRDLL